MGWPVLHRNEPKGDESRCRCDYPDHHLSALPHLSLEVNRNLFFGKRDRDCRSEICEFFLPIRHPLSGAIAPGAIPGYEETRFELDPH